jgi:hypothetical protein
MLMLFVAQSGHVAVRQPVVGKPTVATATVILTLKDILSAVRHRNAEQLRRYLRPLGTATVMVENKDGTRTLRTGDWDAYLANLAPGPERYEERLFKPVIKVDGTIATVWAPYTFFIDGRISHCGINHYHMVLDEGLWKIQNLTFSQRTAKCKK